MRQLVDSFGAVSFTNSFLKQFTVGEFVATYDYDGDGPPMISGYFEIVEISLGKTEVRGLIKKTYLVKEPILRLKNIKTGETNNILSVDFQLGHMEIMPLTHLEKDKYNNGIWSYKMGKNRYWGIMKVEKTKIIQELDQELKWKKAREQREKDNRKKSDVSVDEIHQKMRELIK